MILVLQSQWGPFEHTGPHHRALVLCQGPVPDRYSDPLNHLTSYGRDLDGMRRVVLHSVNPAQIPSIHCFSSNCLLIQNFTYFLGELVKAIGLLDKSIAPPFEDCPGLTINAVATCQKDFKVWGDLTQPIEYLAATNIG